MDDTAKTPLLDLLRSVPSDARAIYEHHAFASSSFPYGRLCAEAADRITELEAALAEAQKDAARYRFLAAKCRSTSEHWGGRWSIVVEGPAPATHDDEEYFDAAIDAAMQKGGR